MFKGFRNFEPNEEFSGNTDVLKLRHQLAVEAAQSVT
jgi:hypothetical protein